MSIWKNKCWFEKVNVDFKKWILIWKNKMLIWKNKCLFEKINVDLKK